MSQTPTPTPVAETSDHHAHGVACDGGGGALGHPKVYLDLHKGSVTCPYCSKVFTADESEA